MKINWLLFRRIQSSLNKQIWKKKIILYLVENLHFLIIFERIIEFKYSQLIFFPIKIVSLEHILMRTPFLTG